MIMIALTTRKEFEKPVREAFVPAMVARFGEASQVVPSWAPNKAAYIVGNLPKAVGVPEAVRFSMCYGSDVVRRIYALHLSRALCDMGIEDKITPNDVNNIAAKLEANPSWRVLNFAHCVAFFSFLSAGRFDLMGYTPYQILSAANRYAVEASATAYRYASDARTREREKEAKEREANAVTFEQWRKGKTIDPKVAQLLDASGLKK